MNGPPEVSILIPIYNEEGLLHSSVVDLHDRLLAFNFEYELLLMENGSTDKTAHVARELCQKFPQVRLIQSPSANYGHALRTGILEARGRYVICDEIDLCDTDFYREALDILRQQATVLVIGSKLIGGARDARPFFRHATSHVYTALLRILFDFRGTDTHGLKAFRREELLGVVQACVVDQDVFASELVLRTYRAGLAVREIPVQIAEKRPPSINLTRRIPAVLKNLVKLTWAIRMKG